MIEKTVSRAGLKLAEAAKAFGYDFRDKVVLDIGSSTGGFTEYALRRGATKVIAVEKGTNQMKAPLRFDPRVILLEKADIFDIGLAPVLPGAPDRRLIGPERNLIDELPKGFDTILADVSFVSLKQVLRHAQRELANDKTDFLVMLKPQFEASEQQLVKGVVKNEKMRRTIAQDFERWLKENGFYIVKKRDNELVGKVGGNRERFYWLRLAHKNR